MRNLKRSSKVFVGVKEVSMLSRLEAESFSEVRHQQCEWKGGGPSWEKQMACLTQSRRREAERSHLGRCAIHKAKEDYHTATSHVDMSRARSVKKDREIGCYKWGSGRGENRKSSAVMLLFLLKMPFLNIAYISLSTLTHHEVCSLWKKVFCEM